MTETDMTPAEEAMVLAFDSRQPCEWAFIPDLIWPNETIPNEEDLLVIVRRQIEALRALPVEQRMELMGMVPVEQVYKDAYYSNGADVPLDATMWAERREFCPEWCTEKHVHYVELD